jgi:hypothetical protein
MKMRHSPAVPQLSGNGKGQPGLVEGFAHSQADAEAEPVVGRTAVKSAQAAEDCLGAGMLAGIEEMVGAGIEHPDNARRHAERLGQRHALGQAIEDGPAIDAAASHRAGKKIAEKRHLPVAQAEPRSERRLGRKRRDGRGCHGATHSCLARATRRSLPASVSIW